jgi:hypothetical protein
MAETKKVCGQCGGQLIGKVVKMASGLCHLGCAVTSYQDKLADAAGLIQEASEGLEACARVEQGDV